MRSLLVGLLFLCSLGTRAQTMERDSLLRVLSRPGNESDRTKTLVRLSEWYEHADFPESIRFAEQALEEAKISTDAGVFAAALSQRADLYWNNGEYDSSISLNRSSMALRESLHDTSGMAENSYAIAMCHYYAADYTQAIDFHRKALEGFRKSGNARKEATTLNLVGLVYHQMGDYPNTIRYLHEFSRARRDFKGYAGRTYNLGNTTPFFRSKEYFEAELAMQLNALQELEEKGGNQFMYTLLNIADCYKELGDYPNALIYHKRAAAHAASIGQQPKYTFLGNAYRSAGWLDSAVRIHKNAILEVSDFGSRLDLLDVYINLGKDFYELKEYNNALQQFEIALRMTTRMGNKLDVVINRVRIANTLLRQNKLNEARQHAEQASAQAKMINSKSWIRDTYLLLSNIHEKMGDFESAYRLHKEHKLLADSLIRGEADLQYAQMQAQFELHRKDEEIRLLNQGKEIQEARIRNKDQFFVGGVAVLLLTLGLAGSTYLRFRQKNRANKILEQQKHQIELLLREIHHRVKNNLQVISSLLSIQSGQLKNRDARMAVLEGQGRVQAMGLIHENIYKTENFAFIEMRQYVDKLSASLVRSFGYSGEQVKVCIETNGLSVDVDTAIPLGLIINELFTNSLKHAFGDTGQPGIWITMQLTDNRQLALEMRDNGRGFVVSQEQSFGLHLVRELTRQLEGELVLDNRLGFVATMRFRKFKLAA